MPAAHPQTSHMHVYPHQTTPHPPLYQTMRIPKAFCVSIQFDTYICQVLLSEIEPCLLLGTIFLTCQGRQHYFNN